jgi:hypothetical protein
MVTKTLLADIAAGVGALRKARTASFLSIHCSIAFPPDFMVSGGSFSDDGMECPLLV